MPEKMTGFGISFTIMGGQQYNIQNGWIILDSSHGYKLGYKPESNQRLRFYELPMLGPEALPAFNSARLKRHESKSPFIPKIQHVQEQEVGCCSQLGQVKVITEHWDSVLGEYSRLPEAHAVRIVRDCLLGLQEITRLFDQQFVVSDTLVGFVGEHPQIWMSENLAGCQFGPLVTQHEMIVSLLTAVESHKESRQFGGRMKRLLQGEMPFRTGRLRKAVEELIKQDI